MSNLNNPLSPDSLSDDVPQPSMVRRHRQLPRPVSTVLDPLQPIPDRKKRLPLQIMGVVVALLLAAMVASGAWLLTRPANMSVEDRVLQARTDLGDLLPEPARPLSTSKRVQATPDEAPAK